VEFVPEDDNDLYEREYTLLGALKQAVVDTEKANGGKRRRKTTKRRRRKTLRRRRLGKYTR
jgi:hypothetical protein